MEIRKMNLLDIEKVRRVDSIVFDGAFLRTVENISLSLQLNPEGCFVAEDKDVIGYIFSRIWGNVAWIGTFGIHPDYRGKGIGKALLDKVIKFLTSRECSIIGLETMASSPYNIGMYTKYGFKLIPPTLILKKELNFKQNFKNFNNDEQYISFDKVSQLSNFVLNGLDYKEEAESATMNNWGKIIFFGNTDPFGFAIIRTSFAIEKSSNYLYVPALVIKSKSEQLLHEAICNVEGYALTNGYKSLMMCINSVNYEAVRWLINRGYMVHTTNVRMIYKGEYCNLNGIDISGWGM